MKISTKDIKLLYVVGGLLLFLVLYMYVCRPLQGATSNMEYEIERLERECRELEIQNIDIVEYEGKIEEYRTLIKEELKQFPVDVKEEDLIAYLMNLQTSNAIDIYSIAFNEPMQIGSFQGVLEVEGEDKAVQMVGTQIGATAQTTLTYAKLKSVLNYIYNTSTQTTLESVKVVYNAKDQSLSGSFDFSRYALTYEDAVYTPEQLPSVTIGQGDVFGPN